MNAFEKTVKDLEKACRGGMHPQKANQLVTLVSKGGDARLAEARRLVSLLPPHIGKPAGEFLGLDEKPAKGKK